MKKMIYIPFLLLIGGMANAEYIITVPLTKSGGGALSDDSINITSDWQNSSTEYGQWTNTGEVYGCSNWSPLTSSITIGQSFTQTATDCSQNQVRTAQDQEVERISGIVQNKGASYIETQTITASDTRASVGTMETWIATTPTYTAWNNAGTTYDCQTWSPSPTTITIGTTFTQTSNDCKQDQERVKQDREVETTTNQVRDLGPAITEFQTIAATSTRDSIGTMETWITTTPTYTDWVNSGTISGCTNWSPEPSTVTIGQTFTQTATDCNQNQTRTRQNRELETTTNQVRNVGSLINESQVITVSSTRNATGTNETWAYYDTVYSVWTNSGAVYSCTVWSPAPSTVTINQSFTQTRSCSQGQTRTRQDREQEQTTKTIRNAGTLVTESQVITVSQSQAATGTKETWVATTPTYTSWANSGGIYGCTNWSPATSTVNQGQSFTQTATDCKQSQVRTKQNREMETTTKQVRNTGTAVSESQVITVSSSRTAIGTKVNKVCQYQSDYTKALYYVTTDYYGTRTFIWNGVSQGATAGSSVVSAGYLYTMGAYSGTDAWAGTPLYQICRESI